MIRTILAVVLAFSIVLFVWRYAEFTDQIKPPPVQFQETSADGDYSMRVVCTFPCQGNSFGFPAMKVSFRDRVLLERQDTVAAGEVVQIDMIPEIQQGLNDFHVQVTPMEKRDSAANDAFSLDGPRQTTNAPGIARCVRVGVWHNGHEIAQDTIWSGAPGPFGDLVRIRVRENQASK